MSYVSVKTKKKIFHRRPRSRIMSALIKSVKIFTRINKNPEPLYPVLRQASHWNKDWKPAELPQNEEERRASAKKYGLLPEEYKTYPNDGVGFGDYPRLEDKPDEQKDPFYPYDFPEYRRNFNEPIHAEFAFHNETRAGIPGPLRISIPEMFLWFFGAIGGSYALYWWLEDKKVYRPAMPKQLPADGQKHYTFTPAR